MPAQHIDASLPASAHVRRSLLLVEEDQDLREILSDLFEFVGHHVVPAHTPGAAVPWVTPAVDAVVLSCGAPPADVTDEIVALAQTARDRQVPLVVLSGDGQERAWARTLGTPYASSLRSTDDLLAVLTVALGS
jgi:DNA-binding response OmpR family regulator